MMTDERIVREVLASLERESRVDLHHFPIRVEYGDGVLTLEGETGSIAAKKLGLELAAAVWYKRVVARC